MALGRASQPGRRTSSKTRQDCRRYIFFWCFFTCPTPLHSTVFEYTRISEPISQSITYAWLCPIQYVTHFLGANVPPDRFYRGAQRICDFRTFQPLGSREPEDWIASTASSYGCESSKLGMTQFPNGQLLADAVANDSEFWLDRKTFLL